MSVTLEDDVEIIPGLFPDGRPDPAYAAALGLVPATAGRRSAAFAIDAAIFLILSSPATVGAAPLFLKVFLLEKSPEIWFSYDAFRLGLILYAIGQGLSTIFLVVQLIVHGLRGLTVGKRFLGLRTVNVAAFTKPGFWRIVLRALVFSAAFVIIPYLGIIPFLLSPLWDGEKRGRGWLDRVSRSWLVDIRRGLDPFDAKRMRHARKAVEAPAVDEAVALPSLATGTAWAGPTFVPVERSSSGVISAPQHEVQDDDWEPPPIATPAPLPRPASVPASVPAPAAPSPIIQRQPEPARAFTLVFDDGERLDVDGYGLLGRNPEPNDGESPKYLFRVVDPARQLSKTHAAFGIGADGFWIMDRGSVNGTAIKRNGVEEPLAAGVRTALPPGSVVQVGGRSFTVVVNPAQEKALT